MGKMMRRRKLSAAVRSVLGRVTRGLPGGSARAGARTRWGRVEVLENRQYLSWIGATSGSGNDAAHDYNNPANWTNGVIDDSFDGVSFSDNTTLYLSADRTTGPAGLSLNYQGSYDLTFMSNSSTARTLTLAGAYEGLDGDFGAGSGRTVTLGDSAAPLNLSMSGISQTLNISAGDTLLIQNAIVSGSVAKYGAGTLGLQTAGAMQSGTLSLYAGTLTQAVPNALSGSMKLRLESDFAGSFSLPYANNYTGGTWINAGAVSIQTGSMLGTGPISLYGGTLSADVAGAISAGSLYLYGGSFSETVANALSGSMQLVLPATSTVAATLPYANDYTGNTGVYAGSLTLTTPGAISGGALLLYGNGQLNATVANAISGSAKVNLASTFTGTLALPYANNYTGSTTLNAGTLSVRVSGALGTGTLSVYGGVLDLQVARAITGGSMYFYGGTLSEATANAISGSARLILQGGSSAVVPLACANDYTGGTYVYGGTLLANGTGGSSTGTGTVAVNGGTLGGTGSIGRPVTVNSGGTISPGDSSGGVLSTGNLSLTSAGRFSLDVSGATPRKVGVAGTVSLGGSNLLVVGARPSHSGDELTLISNDGTDAVSGGFANLAEGDIILVSGVKYRVSYHGGDGNDVTLTDIGTAAATISASLQADGLVGLGWALVDISDSAVIDRSADGGATWTALVTTSATSGTFVDGSVAINTTYQYRIRSWEGSGTWSSGPVSIATGDTTGGGETPQPYTYDEGQYIEYQLSIPVTTTTTDNRLPGHVYPCLAYIISSSFYVTVLKDGVSYPSTLLSPADGGWVITTNSSGQEVVRATISFTPDDNGLYSVVGHVDQQYALDGGAVQKHISGDVQVDLIVRNVAPTATLTVDEGDGTASVSLAGASDPSSADTAAGFRYSFDYDDGDFEDDNEAVIDQTSPTAPRPPSWATQVWGRITDKDGNSSYYGPLALRQGPTAPTRLQASATDESEVNLSWQDNSAVETGYRVELTSDGGQSWSVVGSTDVNACHYTVVGLQASTTYQFRVTAVGAYANSDPVVTGGQTQAAPTGEDRGIQTPSITDSGVASWGSQPAGYYRIVYISGAMQYASGRQWSIQDYAGSSGFVIRSGDQELGGPGNRMGYDTVAALEAANAGAAVYFWHAGGGIGIYLNDTPYEDNIAAPSPDGKPAFRLEKMPDVPVVSISVDKDTAVEGDTANAPQITFSRTGDISGPLDVQYFVAGTATPQVDYNSPSASDYSGAYVVTIPAGQSSISVPVTALSDGLLEGPETLVVGLWGDTTYRLSIACGRVATTVICDVPPPIVSIATNSGGSQVATIQEGTPWCDGTTDNPGFWLSREGDASQPLTIKLRITGDATPGEDYQALPQTVTIPSGQTKVFLPFHVTEDITPEFTESVGVTIVPVTGLYVVPLDGARRAAIDISDDDYFIVGYADSPNAEIPCTVYEPGSDPSGGTQTMLGITDPLGDPMLITGAFDGDYLPWLMGRDPYLAAGGSVENPNADDLLHYLVSADDSASPGGISFDASLGSATFSAATAPLAAALSSEEIGRNLAILEENYPDLAFTYNPAAGIYVGTDAAGRQAWFNLSLQETRYWGTGKMWYLRYNEDGSIDRVQYRYDENDPTVERIKMSDKLKKELQGVFAAAIQQEQEDQERIARLQALSNAVAEGLDAGLHMLPGAVVLDAQEALTGENALRPGMRISGTQQAAAAGNMLLPAALVAAKRLKDMAHYFAEGRQFEKEMLDALRELEHLDVPAQKSIFRAILDTGKLRRTIPDCVIAGEVMIEIKRVQQLNLTPQLEAQIKEAARNGLRYRIIVSDVLQGGPSQPLIDKLLEYLPGRSVIQRYNGQKLEQIWP